MLKLSIVIPMYNAAHSIRGLINAIHDNGIHEKEIILVDDGSTDGTVDVCEELCKEDGTITLIPCEHAGVSTARNRGLKEAKGKYLAFLDADDDIDPCFFSELLAMMEREHLDWAACGYREVWQGKSAKKEKKILPVFDTETTIIAEEDREELIDAVFYGPGKNNLFSVCMGLYRREALEESRLSFAADISYGEDTLFNCDVAHVVKRFGYTPKQLYLYVQNDASSMHSTFKKNLLEKEMALIKALEQKHKERGEAWSDAGLRYVLMQLFSVFRHNILLIPNLEERQRAYDNYLRETKKEPIGHIIEQIQLRHAKGVGEKGFLYLLKGEHFKTIDLLWDGIVKRIVFAKE